MIKENIDRFLSSFRGAFEYEEGMEYKVNIPPPLYNALVEVAREDNVDVGEIFRQGLKLYLLRKGVESDGGNLAVIKSDGSTVVIKTVAEDNQGK